MARARELAIAGTLMVVLPALSLVALEGGARLLGLGFESGFFIRSGNSWISNEKFGWKWFPREIARTPAPVAIPVTKTKKRLFVLGESAAMGFPDPALGLAAHLRSSLGSEWEVINAAMTAISSHAVREIAAQCAQLQPDVFVVYMGNNEVVGPFGTGSIFGRLAPMPLIRSQIWLRQWRAGQAFADWISPRKVVSGEWRGLEFFKDLTVPFGDSRLEQTYSHFSSNALDVVRIGQQAGARVILSTVAVNLRDFPPFASPDGAASAAFAAGDFARSRDLDQLRFRADSRINAILRNIATQTSAELVDAERAIEPSRKYFWEHVHLRPEGNALLATLIAQRINSGAAEPSLPVSGWDQLRMYREIRALVSRPPFLPAHLAALAEPAGDASWQTAWEEWQRRARQWPDDLQTQERIAEMAAANGDYRSAENSYRQLLAQLSLRVWHTGLGEALLQQGRFADAEKEYNAALATDNRFAPAWLGLGVVRAAAGDPNAAQEAFRKALALQPGMPQANNSMGRLLQSQGNLAGAEQHYRTAIERQPDFAVARYNRASVLARLNREPEAITELRAAIRIDPAFVAAHYDLGVLLARQGSPQEAEAEYAEATRLSPHHADAWNNWGTTLARQGKSAEARKKFLAALDADPKHAAARRNLEMLKGQ